MSVSALYSPSSYAYSPQRQHRYAPQTPSPLRTSRNANLMPPPTRVNASKATPESKPLTVSFMTPPSATSTSSTSDRSSTSESNSKPASAPPFQFESRSRSQSPQASLAKSNVASKARRSSLFLDKVRQKREDLRFETRGEQALRMDFVRERRAWEEKLKRRAPSSGIEAPDTLMDEEDHHMEDHEDAENDENTMPSPPEDREIEELLSYLDTDETPSTVGPTSNTSAVKDLAGGRSTLDPISDDEDYDQLFLEVLGDDVGSYKNAVVEKQGWYEVQQDQESSMDLS